MEKYLSAIILLSVFILSGCTQQSSTELANNANERSISLQELAQHNTKEDCWVAIDGNVYNMTELVSIMPNADAMIANCGKETESPFGNRQFQQGLQRPDGNTFQRPDVNYQDMKNLKRDFNGTKPEGSIPAGMERFGQEQQRSKYPGSDAFLKKFYIGKLA